MNSMSDKDILMRYVLTGSIWNQTTKTTLWLRSKPEADDSDMIAYLGAIINDIEIFLLPRFMDFATSDWSIQEAKVEVLAGENPFQVIKEYLGVDGQRPPDALPPHDAGLLSLYTPFHGRRNHGRLYIPGVPESETAGGKISAISRADISAIGASLVSRYGEGSNNAYCWICVFSKKNGVERVTVPPPPKLIYSPLAAIPVSRTVASQYVATQRHRKIGRGI
jgi:hypothetical protein